MALSLQIILAAIKLKLLEDEVAAAEEAIGEWESRIEAAEIKLNVYTSAVEQQKSAEDLARLRVEHAELLTQWESLGMQLEEQRD